MRYIVCLSFALFFSSFLFAQDGFPRHYMPQRQYSGQRISDIITVEEEHMDIGLWALIVAKEYDSTIKVADYLERLDTAAAEIHRMLAGRTTDFDKLLAVRTYLYEAGKWNNFRPYSYDLDDPLGEIRRNKLLSTFMDTRKGNCISMPLLFVALMERIDSDVQLRAVLAPRHLMCRFRDRQSGDVMLIEPTNGGYPARNRHYIENYGVSQKTIESGLYLRDLTKREFIADVIHVLVNHTNEELKAHDRALEYATLQQALFPTGLCGYFGRAVSLEWKCEREGVIAKVRKKQPLTPEEQQLLRTYREAVANLDIMIEATGWEPEDEEQRRAYLEEIEQERRKRQSTNSHPTSHKR